MQLNYSFPCNDTGYGVVGTNLGIALDKHFELNSFPIGGHTDHPAFQESQRRARNASIHAPSLRVFHQDRLLEHVGRGHKLGYSFFELDRLTEAELHNIRFQDTILVPSKWAKQVIVTQDSFLEDRIRVVPAGVDTEIFFPDPKPRIDDVTVFLCVGKAEIRKGHDVLLKAFNLAFEPSDKVLLKIAFDNFLLPEAHNLEWRRLYKESKMGHRIEIVPRSKLPTQKHVAALMNSADYGVFPARAEGFNLEAIEMMACGKPIIATQYSGHTEFLDWQNGFPILVDKLEDAHDGIWFNGQGRWASMGDDQIEQIVEAMRFAHDTKQTSYFKEERGKDALQTAQSHTWDHSARLIKEIFS